MAHNPSTADQLHSLAERIHDIADRFGRSQSRPIAVTEQLIGEGEGDALDLRVLVRGR
jgi:hypothetical protein